MEPEGKNNNGFVYLVFGVLMLWLIIIAIMLSVLKSCKTVTTNNKKATQTIEITHSVPIINPAEVVTKPIPIEQKKRTHRAKDTTCTPNGIDCGAITTLDGNPVTMEEILMLY